MSPSPGEVWLADLAITLWSRQIAEAAAAIPDEDHERFLAAIAAQKSESKESIRRSMAAGVTTGHPPPPRPL